MTSIDLFRLAKNSLWRRKARTILTVSGVMIGTTAIVVMLSIGLGLITLSVNKWNSGGT